MVAASYSQPAQTPGMVLGTYLLLIATLLFLWLYRALNNFEVAILIGIFVLYLARSLSLHYSIKEGELRATRLFGSRHVPLRSISKATEVSLRDLSPVSWTGGWGWRSRMWSPAIGAFDNLSTVHSGIMVYGEGVPLFISPGDREAFLAALNEQCGNRLLTNTNSS